MEIRGDTLHPGDTLGIRNSALSSHRPGPRPRHAAAQAQLPELARRRSAYTQVTTQVTALAREARGSARGAKHLLVASFGLAFVVVVVVVVVVVWVSVRQMTFLGLLRRSSAETLHPPGCSERRNCNEDASVRYKPLRQRSPTPLHYPLGF